ncbi:alpha/beta-hydrolase [Exidia glandulosa HHB12029]|uniref:Carboxylic ester hydrolase n=1 Tax=Exidia glandulosa HHB12029 TaxID=1314781 RepID=A0A165DMD7_EXIGL|nr:alpha/beta-hydrolase [Exidia glandulosa HHB12029]
MSPKESHIKRPAIPQKPSTPPARRIGISYGAAMLCCGLVASALAWALVVPTSVTAKPGTVQLGRNLFQGNTSSPDVTVFYGVPYAQAPVGNLRWRAPRPVATSLFAPTKVIDATSPPLPCIQGTTGGGDAGGAGSEDCLKVNIYTPSNATARSNLPVLVYIHGGGYTYGNPVNWPFVHWVEQDPNVVVVSVYYRLAAIGFLATPELANPAVGDLNVGFLDQVEALRWVQKNIRAFGGDPSRVTINGESAGGSSVELHLVANEQPSLFRGVIAQSVYRHTLATPEQKREQFQEFARRAGCATGGPVAQLACLRKAPLTAIAPAQDAKASYDTPYTLWTPVIDGKVIRDIPSTLLLQGRFKRVPVIVGATTNETLAGGDTVALGLKNFFPQLTEGDITDLERAFPASDYSDPFIVQTVTGASSVRCARDIFVKGISPHENVFVYRYNQPNPTSHQPGNTAHAAENWMMFGGTNTGFNGTTEFTGLNALIAYWLSFVRSQNPNTHKLARSPSWPSTRSTTRLVLQEDRAGSTTRSGMVVEEEPADEVAMCAEVVRKVVPEQH